MQHSQPCFLVCITCHHNTCIITASVNIWHLALSESLSYGRISIRHLPAPGRHTLEAMCIVG